MVIDCLKEALQKIEQARHKLHKECKPDEIVIIDKFLYDAIDAIKNTIVLCSNKNTNATIKYNDTITEEYVDLDTISEAGHNETIQPDNDNETCIFCHVKLSIGYDEDEMFHCQICHNVYDGCAQCVH